jgi:hypothetical protein
MRASGKTRKVRPPCLSIESTISSGPGRRPSAGCSAALPGPRWSRRAAAAGQRSNRPNGAAATLRRQRKATGLQAISCFHCAIFDGRAKAVAARLPETKIRGGIELARHDLPGEQRERTLHRHLPLLGHDVFVLAVDSKVIHWLSVPRTTGWPERLAMRIFNCKSSSGRYCSWSSCNSAVTPLGCACAQCMGGGSSRTQQAWRISSCRV